jgi:hypothetical protein
MTFETDMRLSKQLQLFTQSPPVAACLRLQIRELREIVFQLQKEKYGKGEIEMVEKASSDIAS